MFLSHPGKEMFKHEHKTPGERNCIEQWFGLLKRRTKGFYNNINAKSIGNGTRDWRSGYGVLRLFITGLLGYVNRL